MKLFVVFFLILTCSTAYAEPFTLVTEVEFANEAASSSSVTPPPKTRAMAVSGAPKIKVISPEPVKNVFPTPLPIELQFVSASDAEIDPESFRASYGFLRLNVTNRIVQAGKLTKYGLSIAEADIPKGSHRLLLEVSDTKGRVGESDLRFRIE